jgi:hypothetical protein
MIANRVNLAPRVLPQAPRESWAQIRQLWHRGRDTHAIAKLVGLSEAQVFNSLRRALEQ